MKAKAQSRFSIDALRDRVGDTVFVRGETYHRGGQVQILTVETNRVLAQVAGTEDYRTELRGRGRGIGGHCSCRAFRDSGFCEAAWTVARKHKVSFGVNMALVDASKATYPREALEVFAERVNQLVSTGGNHGYGEAAKVIARIAALQSEAEQAAYIATLKARHRQKRNFMKLLG